jgi:hypothetical protein
MGIFRHLPNDIIEINGEQFNLELFLEIEPEYTRPKDIIAVEYNSETRHILYSSNNQFEGEFPWKDGDRYLLRSPDLHLLKKTIEEDKEYVKQIQQQLELEKHKKDRTTEYPHIRELIVAMWEHFVEERPAEDTINRVQEKRIKVKEKFPNENNL